MSDEQKSDPDLDGVAPSGVDPVQHPLREYGRFMRASWVDDAGNIVHAVVDDRGCRVVSKTTWTSRSVRVKGTGDE